MTALTMRFRRRSARTLGPGDEIVCTRLDHDANVAPWLIAAQRAGAQVRFAEPDRETLELPASAVEAVLSRAHALGRGHCSLQRRRLDPRSAGHRRRRARGRRARLRRRRPRDAAPPDRRRGAGLRRARVLGLQVVRSAHRDPLGAPGDAGGATSPTSCARRPTRSPTAGSSGRCRSSRWPASGPPPTSCSRSTARPCARTRTRCWRSGRGARVDRGRSPPRRRARPHVDGHVHGRRPTLARGRRRARPRRGRGVARQLLRLRARAGSAWRPTARCAPAAWPTTTARTSSGCSRP